MAKYGRALVELPDEAYTISARAKMARGLGRVRRRSSDNTAPVMCITRPSERAGPEARLPTNRCPFCR